MCSSLLDAVQIQSPSQTSLQQFWLFDGHTSNNVAEEVDNLARRCRTVSPGALKQELFNEQRPHSSAGIPLRGYHNCRNRVKEKRHSYNTSRPIYKVTNINDVKYMKVIGKFQPPKFKEKVISPGYVVLKAKDEIKAKIETDQLLDPNSYVQQVKKKPKKQQDDRDQTIEILKHQIDNLSAILEETRLQHKIEMKKMIAQHEEDSEKLRQAHTEHLKAVEADHHEGITKLEESQRAAIENIRMEANQERDQLARELKFTKAAFETYKETTQEELNSKWKEKEYQMKLDFDRMSERFLTDQRHELMMQKNKELDNQSKEQRRQISTIVQSNKKEMDILLRKFTASSADAERVHEFMIELKQIKSENDILSKQLAETKKMYRISKNELNDVKVHLQTYKDHFHEKVAEVDDKYSQKINGLMMDNSALRKQYLKKCDELYKVKSDIDMKKDEEIATAKDLMQQLILSRTRADVSLTALRHNNQGRDGPTTLTSNDETDHNKRTEKTVSGSTSRPLSAPSTVKETISAVILSSGGYENAPKKGKRATTPIPPASPLNVRPSTDVPPPEENITQHTNHLDISPTVTKAATAVRKQIARKTISPTLIQSPAQTKSTITSKPRQARSHSIKSTSTIKR